MQDDQYEWRLLFYSRHSYVTQRMAVESPIRLMLQGARVSAMRLAISFELEHLFQQSFRCQSAKSICCLGTRARNQTTINLA